MISNTLSRWSIYLAIETDSASDTFRQAINGLTQDLLLLLKYYKAPNKSSKDIIESGKVKMGDGTLEIAGNSEKSFIYRISTEISLDEVECFILLRGYLRSDVSFLRIAENSLVQCNNQEIYDDSLLEKVKHHYYMERQATLYLICSLIRTSKNPSHSYYNEAVDALKTFRQGNIHNNVIMQLKQSSATRLPKNLEAIADSSSAWCKNNLQEQKLLLDILILYYYDFTSNDPLDTVKLWGNLFEMELGLNQPNRPYFDNDCNELLENICFLHSVLAIEILSLEKLQAVDGETLSSTLLGNVEHLEAMNSSVWEFMKNPSLLRRFSPAGILAIAWATYMQFCIMLLSPSCPPAYQRFYHQQTESQDTSRNMQILFQLGFGQLRGIDMLINYLQKRWLVQDPNELTYCSIIKGLWNMICLTQNMIMLPDRQNLVSLFVLLFSKRTALCLQFWNEDYTNEECSSLLAITSRSFPADFFSFLKVISSLVGDSVTAFKVFEYVSNMNSFAHDISSDSDRALYELEPFGGADVYTFKGGNIFSRCKNFQFTPPAGCRGFLIGQNTILLDMNYSGWQLFFAYLENYVNFIGIMPNDAILEVLEILRVFNTILEHGDEALQENLMSHIYAVTSNELVGLTGAEILVLMIGDVISKSVSYPTFVAEIYSLCLDILRLLLPFNSAIVWQCIKTHVLLPREERISFGKSYSYLQEIIIPQEMISGTYCATMAFIDLIAQLCRDIQLIDTISTTTATYLKEDSDQVRILNESIAFIVGEIFSTYNTWKFTKNSHKLQLSIAMLNVFNIVMDDTSWTVNIMDSSAKKSHSDPSSLQDNLVRFFNDQSSGRQILHLLELALVGKDFNALSNLDFETETIAISALKVLKCLLIRLLHFSQTNSLLENHMLNQTFYHDSGKPLDFIYGVSRYVEYEFSSELSVLSCEVLTLICALSESPGRPHVSLVGYFGGNVLAFVRNLVSLADERSLKSASEERLQASIINFITTILITQPGLGSIFLTGNLNDNFSGDSKSSQIYDASVLMVAKSILKDWNRLRYSKPVLLSSVSELLDKLWQIGVDHFNTLKVLREDDKFWDSIIEIVTERLGYAKDDRCQVFCYFEKTKAHCLRLLASEAHLRFYSGTLSGLSNKKITKVLCDELFGKIGNKSKIMETFGSFLYDWRKIEEIQHLISSLLPPMSLSQFAVPAWHFAFDTSRTFGSNYVYNTNLFHLKLKSSKFLDEKAVQISNQLIEKFPICNVEWSRADAHLILIKAYSYASKLYITGLAKHPSDLNVSDSLVKDVLESLSGFLKRNEICSSVEISLKNETASLLSFLIPALIKKIDFPQIFNLLKNLIEALELSTYPLGPIGKLSNYSFHDDIFQIVLVILQHLEQTKFESNNQEQFRNIGKELVPFITKALYYLLAEIVQSNQRQISITLAILLELTRLDLKNSLRFMWAEYLEKHQIIPLLFCSLSNLALYKAQENNFATSAIDQILELLLVFSQDFELAKLLVNHGVMATFCNSFVIENMDDNKLELDTFSWNLILATITRLLDHFGSNREFLEYALGFINLHKQRILGATRLDTSSSLSLAEMEELEKVSNLFQIISSKVFSLSFLSDQLQVLVDFQDNICKLLSFFTLLLKSPNELHVRFGLDSNQTSTTNGNHLDRIKNKILSIIRGIFGFLYYTARVDFLLSKDLSGLEDIPFSIQLSMATLWDQPASFGTIFDLIRYVTSSILDSRDKITAVEFKKMVSISELCLSFVTSQLMIFSQIDEEMTYDIRKELANEYYQTFKDMKAILKINTSTEIESQSKNTLDYLIFLDSLVNLRLSRVLIYK